MKRILRGNCKEYPFSLPTFPLEEIAEITEAPLATVKSRLFHGLRSARQILKLEEVERDERSCWMKDPDDRLTQGLDENQRQELGDLRELAQFLQEYPAPEPSPAEQACLLAGPESQDARQPG